MVQFVQKCKEKFFPLWGGSGPFWGPIFWKYSKFFFGLFQGEKMNFSKVAQNDARSLKKIGCIFLHSGGGVSNPKCRIFCIFFFFLLCIVPLQSRIAIRVLRAVLVAKSLKAVWKYCEPAWVPPRASHPYMQTRWDKCRVVVLNVRLHHDHISEVIP